MKRLILTMFLVLAAGFVFYGTADAITGQCSNCHTMHASQDGATTTPSDLLVRGATCLGCHTGTGVTGAPIVDGAVDSMVGSGSFADAVATSSSHTHNVEDLQAGSFATGNADAFYTDPPGWGGTSGSFDSEQLKCAGSHGCHGSHTKTESLDAINGYHHGSKNAYKFLQIGVDNAADTTSVTGIRSEDWEFGGADTGNHNVYYADASGISTFCNNCHDAFHGTTQTQGTGSLWKRHPTDVAVSTIANGNLTATQQTSFNNSINPENHPLAFLAAGATIATGNLTNYNYTNGRVMCLSCHRAHGSQYADILRFDYSNVSANEGGTEGCLGCHIPKR